MRGFLDFIRGQGVMGLAVGFILGGAVSKLVSAIVTDLINPLLGVALGAVGGLTSASFTVGPATFLYGDLIGVAIDFVVVALVVYFGVKLLHLDEHIKKG